MLWFSLLKSSSGVDYVCVIDSLVISTSVIGSLVISPSVIGSSDISPSVIGSPAISPIGYWLLGYKPSVISPSFIGLSVISPSAIGSSVLGYKHFGYEPFVYWLLGYKPLGYEPFVYWLLGYKPFGHWLLGWPPSIFFVPFRSCMNPAHIIVSLLYLFL